MHYKDGTEAKVGDHVFGKLYNTEGLRAGTLISITPGADSCNGMVQFTEAVAVGENGVAPLPRMTVFDQPAAASADVATVGQARARKFRGEAHGSAGAEFVLFDCADYCAINELTKVGP